MTPHDALAADGDAQVLGRLLATRHSCRGFLPQALPRETIERILAMASRTPSWCNGQPWHVNVLSGPTLDALRDGYTARILAGKRGPDLPFPEAWRGRFLARRRECGRALYESLDIGREDRERTHEQLMRNYRFFDAPHLAVVTTEADLGTYGAVDCGGWIAVFLLAAQSLGIAAVPQAAVASDAAFVREFLAVPEGRQVVAGIAFGLADPAHPVNGFRTTRAPLTETVTWTA